MKNEALNSLPSFLRPRLRLFMSVDITGSTHFKQLLLSHKTSTQHKDEFDGTTASEPWLSPILEFYEQVSVIFSTEWNKVAAHVESEIPNCKAGETPSIWKAVGDELIFTKVLTDHRQAYACITAWLATIQTYRKRIKEHSSGLDLKSAAWIAGFPVNNAEIILDHQTSRETPSCDDGDYIYTNLLRLHEAEQASPESSSAKGIRDFIGPSVDTGFRVASVASPRKFVLSADLAFLLAHAAGNLPLNWESTKLNFYYDGRIGLKGVTNGAPYPIFWIDTFLSDELIQIEDQIESRKNTPASDVKRFCELFLEKNKDTHVMRPFIMNDPDALFKNPPPKHLEKLQRLAQYWESGNARRKSEEDAQLKPEVSAGKTKESEPDLDSLTLKLLTMLNSLSKPT